MSYMAIDVIIGLVDATENYMDYGGKLSCYSYVKNHLLFILKIC